MKSVFDLTYDNLLKILLENNFKKYNADQIFEWIYKKKVYDVDKMSNLSENLKKFLKTYSFNMLEIIEKEKSPLTNKYLLKLFDTNTIECVLMKHDYGNSLCVSSQVGCNMNCAFCESGRLKKVRNLSVSEMVLQVLTIEKEEKIRIDSVVVMGIGEPFDNFDNIIDFVSLLTHQKGITIAQRKISVSTCGLVPKIYEFADIKNQVNLAISLHAPNDEIRNKIMPISKVYNLKELFKAIDYYIDKTNRRVTIEYILLDNVNDTKECALELANLLKGKLLYVNLIPYNETSNLTFKRSKDFK
ncbi:MAG: 23S rRNA (adenine(2503)-C(2))-methyltransferase RlmN, partial [Bacilli bacterium]|nr:23S rRNA (adenine(2503)-C(2))-methyltransferase RlmN [Bacilli bacterium]